MMLGANTLAYFSNILGLMGRILDFYQKGEYFRNNPTWDISDTDWKYSQLARLIQRITPNSGAQVCEIGCGSGELLKKLAQVWPEHKFIGWDIAPDASRFWEHDLPNLDFKLGDFLTDDSQPEVIDVILLIDVLEHLADPITFLEKLDAKGKYLVIHLPLDMNLINVLFDKRLVQLRNSIGHIHYFTKAIGEKMVLEAGYEVLFSQYTNAWKDSPNLTTKGKFVRFIRRVLNWINPNLNAKILGGETLVMVAKSKLVNENVTK